MKIKNHFLHRVSAAAFAAGVLTMSSPIQAATFTWDGGDATSNSWGTANNWNPNGAPAFGNTADLVFNNLTRSNNFLGAVRTVRSITYGADIDGTFQTNYQDFSGGTSRVLTMDADTGNASITVLAGATGDITLGTAGGTGTFGTMALADNLDVVHNGSGLLLFNRAISGTGFGITKTGTGTMQTNSNNTFTGAININQGTLIANSFDANGADLNNASAINLGGGALEIRASSGVSKTYATAPVNVTAASTLTYNNVNATTYTAQFTGANAFALNANLTVRNVSTNTTVTNAFNIARNITGSGDMIVETFNNIADSSATYSHGRVALSGDNSAWSGDLVVAKGTATLGGTTSLSSGAGDIIIGETGNAFGAGLSLGAAATGIQTLANDIIVRSGGFRSIRGSSDHFYNLDGNITLEGDLNVDTALFAIDKRITLNGNISGVGGLDISKSGTGSFTRVTGNNTYSGSTTIHAGADFRILSTTNFNGIGDTSAVTLTGTGSRLVIESAETIGSLSSTGSDGILTLNADLTTGGNNQSTIYGGTSSGTGGLTKVGPGTLTLSGTNTYTGITTVTAGKLVVSESIGNSAVTVSGTGTVLATDVAALFGSTLAIQNGAILAAGDAAAAGTASVTGTTTFNNGSIFSWDIDSTGTSYDKLVSASLVDGDAAGGSVFRIVASDATFANAFWNTTKTWTDIFTTDGAVEIADWADIFTSVTVVNSSFNSITPVSGSFSVSGSTLTWTAVPEPSSALAGLLLTAGLLRRRRQGLPWSVAP